MRLAKKITKKPTVKKKRMRRKVSSAPSPTYKVKEGTVDAERSIICWKCETVLNGKNSTIQDYGMSKENFYYVRKCNECGMGVKYKTTTGFERIPTVEKVAEKEIMVLCDTIVSEEKAVEEKPRKKLLKKRSG